MTRGRLAAFEAHVASELRKLLTLPGFLGAALLETEKGLILQAVYEGEGGNIMRLANTCSKLVRDKRAALEEIGVHDYIEDVLVTLGRQYHFVRPFRRHDGFALYLTVADPAG